jgi:amylosucrase
MPWHIAARRDAAGTLEQRVFTAIQQMAVVRRAEPAMSAGGSTRILHHADNAVLSWLRHHPRHGRFVGFANFAARDAVVARDAVSSAGVSQPRVVLGQQHLRLGTAGLELAPYGIAWLVDDADGVLQPARY